MLQAQNQCPANQGRAKNAAQTKAKIQIEYVSSKNAGMNNAEELFFMASGIAVWGHASANKIKFSSRLR